MLHLNFQSNQMELCIVHCVCVQHVKNNEEVSSIAIDKKNCSASSSLYSEPMCKSFESKRTTPSGLVTEVF